MLFPHYRQYDRMDCGPTCLRIIAKYFGKSYSLENLRERCYLTKKGVSLLGISEGAESIGFHTQGAKLNWDQLVKAPLPCIVHWREMHFVVIYKIKPNHSWVRKILHYITKNKTEPLVFVSDPAKKNLQTYPKSEFIKNWCTTKDENNNKTGIVLLFEPTPDFYENEEKNNRIRFGYLINYLRPYAKHIIQLVLASLVGSLLGLIFPFLTQSIVDHGIGNNDIAFVTMVLFAQTFLSIGQMFNSLIRSWVMLYVTSRLSISMISNFLTKLMKLPISFFDIKMVGDIMQRIRDHSRIQSFLTGALINVFFSTLNFLAYSLIMASYHLPILGIFYAGNLISFVWVFLFFKKRRKLDQNRFVESSANQNNLVQLINGMQEIKLNNCEKQKRWEWERIQARLFRIRVNALILAQSQQIGSSFVNQLKSVLISFLAAKAVIDGDMTLGMMMAMQQILGQLNSPIQQFIGFATEAQDAKMSLERLNEIQSKDDEESLEDKRIKDIPKGKSLIIRNVVFQYEGPQSEKVLNDISLEIHAQKVTAIVGSSGSGKSTIIKLLLGFYEQSSGSIELNSIPLERYSPGEWRRNCGIVMQEGYIFSDTIERNITISDENLDNEKLINALRTARIDEFVNSLPLGIKTKIGIDGHGLSSGQKQRILIARAIYKNPEYIFLDEATNALDSKNENNIMQNMKEFFHGRTAVVIAHRLSTIKNADQIVVLESGKIVEVGTHNELLTKKGDYYELVKTQLELKEKDAEY